MNLSTIYTYNSIIVTLGVFSRLAWKFDTYTLAYMYMGDRKYYKKKSVISNFFRASSYVQKALYRRWKMFVVTGIRF